VLGSFVPVIDAQLRDLEALQIGHPKGSRVVSLDFVIDMLLDMRALAENAVHSDASPVTTSTDGI